METAVANLVAPGTRVLSVVTGYFADRLAQMATRYGGEVTRVEAEWGRAIDPEQVRQALEGVRRRRRHDRARRNLDRRAQSRSGGRGDRARAWRARDRRCGHVAWRHAARRRRVGTRRRLQLQPEMSRRAVGHVADRVLAARAREEGGVPQLLLRCHAARRLLGAAQVSPHDVGVADLRAARSAGRRRRRRTAGALGAARAPSPRVREGARAHRACRCCRRRPNGCGR